MSSRERQGRLVRGRCRCPMKQKPGPVTSPRERRHSLDVSRLENELGGDFKEHSGNSQQAKTSNQKYSVMERGARSQYEFVTHTKCPPVAGLTSAMSFFTLKAAKFAFVYIFVAARSPLSLCGCDSGPSRARPVDEWGHVPESKKRRERGGKNASRTSCKT